MDFLYNLGLIVIVNFLVFCTGLFGLFATRRNMIIILMSLEIVLLSTTNNFALFACYIDDIAGQVFSFFILTVAAAESSLGLALLVLHYRHKAVISVDTLSYLKG
jgi:NADH-quinone oxidoreductase subunit K